MEMHESGFAFPVFPGVGDLVTDIASIQARKKLRFYDYADSLVPMLAKMREKRGNGFKTLGYNQTPNGLNY
jgi:hypothetical protein